MKKKIQKFLCYFDLHSFKYYHEKRKIIGIKNINELNIPVRECKRCGIRQHHLMPKCGGFCMNWRPYNSKNKNEIIKFKIKKI